MPGSRCVSGFKLVRMARCICGIAIVALTAGATFGRGVHVLSCIYLSTYQAVVFVFRVSPYREVLLCYFSQKTFWELLSNHSNSGSDCKHVWPHHSAQMNLFFNGPYAFVTFCVCFLYCWLIFPFTLSA